MKLVIIKKNGTMDDIATTLNKKKIISTLSDLSSSHGEGDIKLLYSWPYEGKNICCYGWYDGEAGFENKHDLPPSGNSTFLESDSSIQLLFGDLFILRSDKNKFYDFEISDYGEFYNLTFGGFDTCDSEDEEIDIEEEEIDEDFNPNLEDEGSDSDENLIDEEDGEELNEDYNNY